MWYIPFCLNDQLKILYMYLITCNDFGLSKHHIFRGPSLSLLQLLPNAGDHAQITLQAVGHLLTNQLQRRSHHSQSKTNKAQLNTAKEENLQNICLSNLIAFAKNVPSFRMPQNHPVDAAVFNHCWTTGEKLRGDTRSGSDP